MHLKGGRKLMMIKVRDASPFVLRRDRKRLEQNSTDLTDGRELPSFILG